jgi:phage protein D
MSSAIAPTIQVFLTGAVPDGHVIDCTIDRDIGHPDMATLVLANQGDPYSATALGHPLVVSAAGATMFDGEVIALEPTYRGGDRTQIVVRAVNRLHRLARVRRSMTFTDKTDRDIIGHVATAAGLELRWQHDTTVTHQHVYHYDQTDLDLVRARAARLGCHVWCVGRTLYVQVPQLGDALDIHLSVDADSDGAQLRAFTPRMSAAGVVGGVTVKGWNPETKQLVIGTAVATRSPLGRVGAAVAAGAIGNADAFTVDHPIWSREEADALARARLQTAALGFITGEAEITGNPHVELGKTVAITANASDDADPFNGRYYVMGMTHRHSARRAGGGFVTTLRFARDAQGKP